MPLTRQQVFDNAYIGVLKQGKIAYAEGKGTCVYRLYINGGTCKCAIGHSIPDDKYDPEFEDSPLGEIISQLPDIFIKEDAVFYRNLQHIHDACEKIANPMETFIRRMKEFADANNLTVPIAPQSE